MTSSYVFLVLLATTQIVEGQLGGVHPVRFINKFSSSADLEWDFVGNYTTYVLDAVVHPIFPPKVINFTVKDDNKVTLRDLEQDKSYHIKLRALKQCGETKDYGSNSLLELSLPKNVSRQEITKFHANKENFMITWDPVADVSHYVLTYRGYGTCIPGETKIITPQNCLPITRILLQFPEMTINFNVRVLNYTNSSINSTIIYPKADRLQVSTSEFIPTLPSFKILNKFSTSMDLEWDFVDEITKYTITVATEDSINTTVMVQNNKATLSNLIPDVQYRISLSTTVGKENTVKGVQFVTLPIGVDREMIESFNAKDGKISWEPTEHASHYIFTYRPKSSSSPKQKSILTKSTEIETNILKYEEGTRTLLLNVRVYNYTSKPSDTDEEVVYPKANQLELHVGKSTATAIGTTSTSLSMLIILLVSLCLA